MLTLCDGTKLLVAETVDELVERVRDYRSHIISRAELLATPSESAPALHVVPFPAREV